MLENSYPQAGFDVNKRVFFLVDPAIRRRAAAYIVEEAPEGYSVTVREPTRNAEQNARFHAMAGDIAKAGVEWAGKKRTAVQWKVLLVSGHATATKEGSEMVPGLEGEFVNIRESTAEMSVRRSASLIDYTRAFGDMHEVVWKEPVRGSA